MVSHQIVGGLETTLDAPRPPGDAGEPGNLQSRVGSGLVPALAALWEHWLWVAVALGYIAAVIGVSHAIGRPEAVSLSLYSPILIVLLCLLLIGFALGMCSMSAWSCVQNARSSA